jgi:hypothetical protein
MFLYLFNFVLYWAHRVVDHGKVGRGRLYKEAVFVSGNLRFAFVLFSAPTVYPLI